MQRLFKHFKYIVYTSFTWLIFSRTHFKSANKALNVNGVSVRILCSPFTTTSNVTNFVFRSIFADKFSKGFTERESSDCKSDLTCELVYPLAWWFEIFQSNWLFDRLKYALSTCCVLVVNQVVVVRFVERCYHN